MKKKDNLFHHSTCISLLILTLLVFRPDMAACAAPTLEWVGYYGLWNDGVTPDYGTTSTTFTFKVIYTDSDNDAPYTGYPKVHILKDGSEIGSYTMTQDSCEGGDCDGNYTNGERYLKTTTLASNGIGIYTYYFEAKDSNEDIAGFSSPTNEHTFTVVSSYVWVDYDTGSNTTGTGSQGSPYQTIAYGISQASSGQAVRVLPRDSSPYYYQESFTMADGVHVVSDNADSGDAETAYDDPFSDYAPSMLTRTGRTIIRGNGPIIFPETLTADVVLDGFTVFKGGPGPGPGSNEVIEVKGKSPIIKNNIIHFSGDNISCLEVGGASGAPIIENNLIHSVGTRGISVSSYVSPLIQDNEIWGTVTGAGIGISSKTVYSGVITILNNHIFDCGGPGIGSSSLAKLLTVIIQGNDIHDNGFDTSSPTMPRGAGISLERAYSPNDTLEIIIGGPDPGQGNEIYNNRLAGIRLDGSDMSFNPVLIQNNTIHDNGTAGLLLIDVGLSGNRASILDNNIYGHTYAGINIGGATYADILNNEINGNYSGIAFRVDYFNSYCIDVDVPYPCCTGPGTGTCTSFNSYCTDVGIPYPCCTGAGTGTCDIIDNSDCTDVGVPYPCCTGEDTGTCNFITDPDPPSSGTVAIGGIGTAEGNNIYSNTMAGIAVRDAITGEVTIAGNDIYSNQRGGIGIVNSCNLVVNRNDIHDNIRGGIHTGSDVADDYFGDADSDCIDVSDPYPCCTGPGIGTCYSPEGFIGPADSAFLDVSQNKVYGNGSSGYGGGIVIRHASGTIYNNLVYGNHMGGIRFGDYIDEIINNTVADNGNETDGIRMGGGIIYDDLDGAVNDKASGNGPVIPIRNNISAFNFKTGIRTGNRFVCLSDEYRDFNLVYGNNTTTRTFPRPQLGSCSKNGYEIVADPLFVDRDNDDYRIKYIDPDYSPAADAGDYGYDYNSECTAAGDPYPCCTGAGTGTCPTYSYGNDVSIPPGVGTTAIDMGAYGGPYGIDW